VSFKRFFFVVLGGGGDILVTSTGIGAPFGGVGGAGRLQLGADLAVPHPDRRRTGEVLPIPDG